MTPRHLFPRPSAHTRLGVRVGLVVACLVLVACGGTAAPDRSETPPVAPSPTTGPPQSPGSTPHPQQQKHQPQVAPVALIVMENHEYGGVVGSSDAPYLNSTLINHGQLFTNYTAVSHPSLPNYLAMTSGSTANKAGTDSVTAGEIGGDNLFHQLSKAGLDWRAFQETMPTPCYKPYSAGAAPGDYALKHDPAMTYANVADSQLCQNVVPLTRLDPHHLPEFSFITPNECNDMHSCPVQTGDVWLSRTVPRLLAAGATVVITFDEGATTEGGGGHVLLLQLGPGIRGGSRSNAPFDHYGLLAGLEDHFGLPRLGAAVHASPVSIGGRPSHP